MDKVLLAIVALAASLLMCNTGCDVHTNTQYVFVYPDGGDITYPDLIVTKDGNGITIVDMAQQSSDGGGVQMPPYFIGSATVLGVQFDFTRDVNGNVDVAYKNQNDAGVRLLVTSSINGAVAIDHWDIHTHASGNDNNIALPIGSTWVFQVWIWASTQKIITCALFDFDDSCYTATESQALTFNG